MKSELQGPTKSFCTPKRLSKALNASENDSRLGDAPPKTIARSLCDMEA